jgi:hypothetical protein
MSTETESTPAVATWPLREFSCRVCSRAMVRSEAWITPRTPGGDVSYRCERHKTPDCHPVT